MEVFPTKTSSNLKLITAKSKKLLNLQFSLSTKDIDNNSLEQLKTRY